jgi:EamA domain-containing membrane protein RarD
MDTSTLQGIAHAVQFMVCASFCIFFLWVKKVPIPKRHKLTAMGCWTAAVAAGIFMTVDPQFRSFNRNSYVSLALLAAFVVLAIREHYLFSIATRQGRTG